MGAEQSLPQTAVTEQSQQQQQPSFLTRMLDPFANLPEGSHPRATQLAKTTSESPSHSRSSSVNTHPTASTSHISLSLEQMPASAAEQRQQLQDDQTHHEQRVIDSAMSRIAPPSVTALLSSSSSSSTDSPF